MSRDDLIAGLEHEIGQLGEQIATTSAEVFDAYNEWCVVGRHPSNDEVTQLLIMVIQAKCDDIATKWRLAVLARVQVEALRTEVRREHDVH